jgi:hypothetical protein
LLTDTHMFHVALLQYLAQNVDEFAAPTDVWDVGVQQVAAMSAADKLAHVGMWDQQKGVTITGYTALACFSALCTTVVMAAMYVFKKWRGIKEPSAGYVQVVKQGDV